MVGRLNHFPSTQMQTVYLGGRMEGWGAIQLAICTLPLDWTFQSNSLKEKLFISRTFVLKNIFVLWLWMVGIAWALIEQKRTETVLPLLVDFGISLRSTRNKNLFNWFISFSSLYFSIQLLWMIIGSTFSRITHFQWTNTTKRRPRRDILALSPKDKQDLFPMTWHISN